MKKKREKYSLTLIDGNLILNRRGAGYVYFENCPSFQDDFEASD
jgi:hypothetical protein